MGQKLPYDSRYWHNIQPPELMDLSRRFEYDEDVLNLLRKWLRLSEGASKTIVEVGCGSGYFTEKLLEMAPGSKITAVEPDDVLREHAERRLAPKVDFVEGTAECIPLPSNFSDLTVCHIVINNLLDVHKAVAEMSRVTKMGGIVAAIEPSGGGFHYYPDAELNELNEKAHLAYGRGVWNLRTKLMDYSRDIKQKKARYPEIFYSCGLSKIEAHGLLSVFLLSDPRRDPEELFRWLEARSTLQEKDKARLSTILERGGFQRSLIEEYH
ncbi:MAG: class I SAM-dependent methyltransferase [Candidatus Bathyarchaeia archaeon]